MINLKKTNDGGLEAFSTKAHKYTPIKVGSAMSVKRWTAYERLNIAFGFNRTFTQLYESIVQMENLVASDNPFPTIRKELILSLNSFKKGIVEESKTRYNHAFYLCTIFMLKDDQKLSEWTIEDAEETIKDWEENEVNEQDLFFFCSKCIERHKGSLKAREARDSGSDAKIIGPWYLGGDGKHEDYMGRFNKELRQATEFIMKQKPYSLSDIDGMGIDVFLDIIDECITSN